MQDRKDYSVFQVSGGYEGYCRDESRAMGEASTISFPASEAEVRAIVRQMAEDGIPITVQGGRTGLAAGAVPHGGHVMNLTKMTDLLGLRKEGDAYYVRLQPGAVLSVFNKAVADKALPHGGWDEASLRALKAFEADRPYFFPTDPTETSATLGGMVACNASGAKSFRYGSARPHVSGLRLVLADGDVLALKRGQVFAKGYELELTTEGGRLLRVPVPTYRMPASKNASGYFAAPDMDALDLLIGSDGTLGVLTEIEVRLSPLPPVIWGASCFFEGEQQAAVFTELVRGEVPQAAALEYFDAGALDILRAQKQTGTAFSELPEVPGRYGCCVYAELHCGDAEEARASLLRVGECMQKAGGSEADSWVSRTDMDRERAKFFRHAVPESVNMLIDERKKTDPVITKLGADMSVPDDKLHQVLCLYREGLAYEGLESAIWGHIGNNHLHVNVLPRNEEDYHKGKELFRAWAAEVTRMGGAVSAEHGVGKLKRDFLTAMYGPEHIKEMAAVKAAFDPDFLFGRGNLFDESLQKEVEA